MVLNCHGILIQNKKSIKFFHYFRIKSAIKLKFSKQFLNNNIKGKSIMYKIKIILSFILLFSLIFSCTIFKKYLPGDKLYFCEKIENETEVGEGKSFPPGKVSVMIRLTNPIGVSAVDLNIVDLNTGSTVQTLSFTVESGWSDIHFDDINFNDEGKYKLSCLKKDGTLIISGIVEIEK